MSYTIELEGHDKIQVTDAGELCQLIERLTPNGGPGFIIVRSSGADYAQSAGGNGTYIVETREYSETRNHFAHFIAGKSPSSDIHTQVKTNGFSVHAMENEVLSIGDVKFLLTEFLNGKPRCEDYFWRDKTSDFEET